MKEYNIQDVALLEDLYNKVLPWIKNHPNHNVHADGHVCPSCGSDNIKRRGTAVSQSGTYQRYQCRSCASWSQGTKSLRPTVEIKHAV